EPEAEAKAGTAGALTRTAVAAAAATEWRMTSVVRREWRAVNTAAIQSARQGHRHGSPKTEVVITPLLACPISFTTGGDRSGCRGGGRGPGRPDGGARPDRRRALGYRAGGQGPGRRPRGRRAVRRWPRRRDGRRVRRADPGPDPGAGRRPRRQHVPDLRRRRQRAALQR